MTDLRLVTLKCPNCNGQLEIGPQIDSFACGYCGSNVQVQRGGNIISLHLLTQSMAAVQRGTDRTAAELAIRRLTEKIKVAGARLTAAQEQTRQAKQKWEKELKSVAPGDALLPTALTSVIALILVNLAMGQIPKVPEALATGLAVVVATIIAVGMWKNIRRHQRVLIDEKRELSLREMTSLEVAEREAKEAFETLKSRLNAQRAIVDGS